MSERNLSEVEKMCKLCQFRSSNSGDCIVISKEEQTVRAENGSCESSKQLIWTSGVTERIDGKWYFRPKLLTL